MRLSIFKSKIHRATVTHADLNYEGSVTVDADLLDAAAILPFEAVHIWNITRGTRLITYALAGPRGSGEVCVNGAAAHLNQAGDLVILATYAEMSPEEARVHQPKVVRVDRKNRVVASDIAELPGPLAPLSLTTLDALERSENQPASVRWMVTPTSHVVSIPIRILNGSSLRLEWIQSAS